MNMITHHRGEILEGLGKDRLIEIVRDLAWESEVRRQRLEQADEPKKDSVIEAVRADLLQRSQLGIKKYGVTLGEQTDFALRGRLQHAYEEALDLANYLKWAITMLDAK